MTAFPPTVTATTLTKELYDQMGIVDWHKLMAGDYDDEHSPYQTYEQSLADAVDRRLLVEPPPRTERRGPWLGGRWTPEGVDRASALGRVALGLPGAVLQHDGSLLSPCPVHGDWDLWTDDDGGTISHYCTAGCSEERVRAAIEACRAWLAVERDLGRPPGRSSGADSTSWEEVDLLPAWAGERVEPSATVLERSDGVCLLGPGINYLFGDSGDGKSWIAILAAVQCMREGRHVAWITYEDVNELEIVKRLKLLGATEDDLDYLSLMVATEAFDIAAVDKLARLIRERQTALVVLDSVGEALAVEGIDEDRDAEFGPWARRALRALLDYAAHDNWARADGTRPNAHVAVLPIDHSTKAKDNAYFPSGTKRKRAMVTGAMYMLTVRVPFGVGQLGRVSLVAAKDRSGRFRRGETAAVISLDARQQPYVTAIMGPLEGAEMIGGESKRRAAERAMSVLSASLVPLSADEVTRLVNGDRNRRAGEKELVHDSVRNALAAMARAGDVTVASLRSGVGNGVKHVYGVSSHNVQP